MISCTRPVPGGEHTVGEDWWFESAEFVVASGLVPMSTRHGNQVATDLDLVETYRRISARVVAYWGLQFHAEGPMRGPSPVGESTQA